MRDLFVCWLPLFGCFTAIVAGYSGDYAFATYSYAGAIAWHLMAKEVL